MKIEYLKAMILSLKILETKVQLYFVKPTLQNLGLEETLKIEFMAPLLIHLILLKLQQAPQVEVQLH